MLEFVKRYGANKHSQNLEDGLISECLHRMHVALGHSVEVGGNDGFWLSNTRSLIEKNWSGLFIEADWNLYLKCKENWAHNSNVRVQCSRVDGQNINAFVDDKCDVLSVDTDGLDYEIFKGLKAKPKIVIVEIDSGLDPSYSCFNSDGGANYFAMLLLGITQGYFLLAHTGNMIFIRNDYRHLFPELTAEPLVDIDQYFNRSWLRAA